MPELRPTKEGDPTIFAWHHEAREDEKCIGKAHHKSLASLRASAASCEMCRMIEVQVSTALEDFRRWKASLGVPTDPQTDEEPSCELWVSRPLENVFTGLFVWSLASRPDGSKGDDFYLVAAVGSCVEDGE